MKKTLLFFLLLFTNYFYAQVNDIEHCFRDTQFDLTINQSLLLGNLNPVETTISYHLSAEDATANINAIAQPTAYTSSALSKTIYARIDNQGTITTKFFNIKVYQDLTLTTVTSPARCNGQNDGSLTVVPSGGKTPYAYSLDGGPFTVYIGNPIGVFNNLPAGTHTIILKDALGCPSMQQAFQITEPTVLVATTTVSNQNVIVTATGGTVPYQYSLDGMSYSASNVFQVITPGSYTPRVRDVNGCIVMVPVTVLPPLNATVAITKEVDCNSGAVFTVTASGGQLPYQYSIDGGATFQTNNVFFNLPARTYNIVVKDAVNTVSNGTPIVIYPPFPIGVNTTVSPITCSNNAIITVIATGGQGPYLFSLDGGVNYSSNNTFSNLLAGTYSVAVKDQKNCVSSIFNVTIDPFLPLSATASNTSILCNGDSGSVTVNATGGKAPYQYSINDGAYATSNTFDGLTAGTYTLKVRDAVDCVSTINHIINQPTTALTALLSISGADITLTPSGGTAPYQYSLDGGPYQTSNIIKVLTSGNYTVQVRDFNGCIKTFATSITVPNPLTCSTIITKAMDCISGASVTVNAAGGKPPYIYSINGGISYQSTNTFTNISAGTYTIKVKDAENTISNSNTITLQTPSPVTASFIYTNVRCIGSNDGSVQITATGGKAPYTYSLNNNPYSSSNVINNLAASNYTINVKDDNGCLFTFMVTISQPDALSASTVVKAASANGNDGEITVNPFGGVAPYVYSIAADLGLPSGPFQLSNVFTGLQAGSYIAKVRDANGCEFNSVTIIVKNPSPLTSTAVITKTLDCISNATITATAIGGQSPYTYSIDGGATYQSGNVFTNVVAGTYNVIVKDVANTFSNTNTIVINPPVQLVATLAITKPLDCNGSASIKATVTGGTASYQYSINNGAYSAINVFYVSAAGNYIINIRDSAGCIVQKVINIPSYNPISISNMITNVTCFGGNNGSIRVLASSGVSPYTYSIGTTYQASNLFTNLAAGNYVVSVKDKQGCVRILPAVITQPAAIAIATNITNATCYDSATGAITVNASGGTYPYTYSIDDSNYSANNTFSNLAVRVYTLYVKDNKGCVASSSATISQPNALVLDVDVKSINNDGSIGGLIKLNASGGKAPYLYSVRNDTRGVQVSLNQNIRIYSGMAEGYYTISVTDANGCKVTNSNVNVTITNPIVLNAAKTPISCIKNASLVVTASGGVAPYLYSYDSGVTYTTNNPGLTNLTVGTYSILLKDAIGNEAQSYFIVKPYVPVKTTATVSYETSEGYVAGVITMSSSNGVTPYTYKVKDSATGKVIFDNSLSIGYIGLPEGTYSITAKDANGCESESVDATLVLPEPILISISNVTPITCENTGESLNISASGGVPPYLYSVDLGETYRSITGVANLKSGLNYIFYAKDAIGNTSKFYYKVKTYVPLTLDLTKTDVNCNGAQDGTVVAAATGGNAPYTYSIGNGFTSSKVFSNLAAGQYNVTVKDAVGCTTTTTITIVQPTLLAVTTSVINATTTNGGNITVTAFGGTLPYSYSLQNNNGSIVVPTQTSNVFTDLTPGSYSVKVTDSRGCIILQSGINILVTSPLVATYTVIPVGCSNPAIITVIAIGGTAPYTYSFDNGITYTTSNIFSTFTSGNYEIKVSDAQNNITSIVAVLSPLDPLSLVATVVSSITCSQNGTIEATVSGGRAPYDYSLNGGPFQVSNTFIVPAGTHTISARDINGCLVMVAVELKQPEPLIASVDVEGHTATITVAGGLGSYLYAISPNFNVFTSSNTFTNLEVGNYSVIVQDPSGCYITLSFVIEPPAPLVEGKEATTIEFKPGQTLADLIVEGENIQWYSSQNPSGGKNNKTNETPLPLTTILVDGVTYYASQTINGVESKERLAVTAKSNGSLSTPDFVLPNFKYYPNPVKHILTINNTALIDEIEIYAASGQSILSKRIDSDHSEIDLSNVSSGLYFLKVKSEGQVKIVKLVKK